MLMIINPAKKKRIFINQGVTLYSTPFTMTFGPSVEYFSTKFEQIPKKVFEIYSYVLPINTVYTA